MCMTSAGAEIGTVEWQQIYNPTSSNWNNGFFYSVGFNSDGSILACGWRGEADSDSAVGVRFDADTGAIVDTPAEWFLFESTWSDYTADRFHDQYVDSNGNTYFVGIGYAANWNTFQSRYNVPNIWKYDSKYEKADRPLWRKYHAGAGTPTDNNGAFYSMAADSAENIYAVGYFTDLASTSSNRDWIIDKYDTDGNRAAGFPLTHNNDNLDDYAYDVATDSDDNFIVVGAVIVDAATDHHDWVVRKYSGDGTLIWATQYDFEGNVDQALTVTVDSDDNVLVGGYRRTVGVSGYNDWYLVKYAKDGNGSGGATILWDQSWDDGGARHGAAYAMVLDDKQNMYIIGNQLKDGVEPDASSCFSLPPSRRDI